MPIPKQHEVDLTLVNGEVQDPETYALWALDHLPNIGRVPMMAHIDVYKSWSKQIVEAGFVHVDSLTGLANDDGFIHVDQLPKQTKRFRVPSRGPRHGFNASGSWVDMDVEDPEPHVIPDVNKFTAQEDDMMIQQYIDKGLIKPEQVSMYDSAEVTD